jgi:hypothetical protein
MKGNKMSQTTKFEQEVLEFFYTDTGAANYLFMYTTYAKMDEFARIGITDLPFSEMVHCESCGGYEGAGEDVWVVFQFKKDGQVTHIIFEGSYMSYDGSEYDSCHLVTPETIQVTAWRNVKSGNHIYQ